MSPGKYVETGTMVRGCNLCTGEVASEISLRFTGHRWSTTGDLKASEKLCLKGVVIFKAVLCRAHMPVHKFACTSMYTHAKTRVY